MIRIITNNNIDEMLRNPTEYINDEEDVVLVEVHGKDVRNPVMLMVGLEDESVDGEIGEPWYIIEEDNDVSIYHHCTAKDLPATYKRVLKKLVEEADQ